MEKVRTTAEVIACLTCHTGREILSMISQAGQTTIAALTHNLGKSKSTVHHHLEKMVNAGIVSRSRSVSRPGRAKVYYRLANFGKSEVFADTTFARITIHFGAVR